MYEGFIHCIISDLIEYVVISNLLLTIHNDGVCQLLQDKFLHLANIYSRFVGDKFIGHTVND